MSDKNGSSDGKPDVEALRAEIVRTRSELGETVQALAAKADVKARAKEQVELTKQRVRAQAADAGERVREVAQVASGKVRAVASQAGETARDNAAPARREVRDNPIPYAAVLAGAVVLVAVALIVRSRRR